MNVKVQPATELDGIPDFLKRVPAADVAKIEGATEKPAGADEAAGEAAEPTALPPDNPQREQARMERFAKIAKREQSRKAAPKAKAAAEIATDATAPATDSPAKTAEQTDMTKTTKKAKAKSATDDKVISKKTATELAAYRARKKAAKAAGPHEVAAFTKAAKAGKAAPEGKRAAGIAKMAAAKAATAKATKAPKAKAAAAKAPRAGKKGGAPVAGLREGTKQAHILSMLATKGGTTVAKIMKATDWQPHTVRAFLSAVVGKKLGLNLTFEKVNGERVYRTA
jgi:hypothetical protein